VAQCADLIIFVVVIVIVVVVVVVIVIVVVIIVVVPSSDDNRFDIPTIFVRRVRFRRDKRQMDQRWRKKIHTYSLRRGWDQHFHLSVVVRHASTISLLPCSLTTVAANVPSHSITITAACHEADELVAKQARRIDKQRKKGKMKRSRERERERESDRHRAKESQGEREKNRGLARKPRREARAKFRRTLGFSYDVPIRGLVLLDVDSFTRAARVFRWSCHDA